MDLSRAAYSRDLKIAVMRALDAGSASRIGYGSSTNRLLLLFAPWEGFRASCCCCLASERLRLRWVCSTAKGGPGGSR